jgi:carbon monoxide dehydrogenase subunit G
MNITGAFTTATPVGGLRALGSRPELLEQVSTLRDVRAGGAAVVHAVFLPVIALGRIPLATTITTLEESETGARLRVTGRRGVQLVDVDLRLEFAAERDRTTVTWQAEVVVRGNAASVGQRVARDIAARAIGDVLAEAAAVAGEIAVTAPLL